MQEKIQKILAPTLAIDVELSSQSNHPPSSPVDDFTDDFILLFLIIFPERWSVATQELTPTCQRSFLSFPSWRKEEKEREGERESSDEEGREGWVGARGVVACEGEIWGFIFFSLII